MRLRAFVAAMCLVMAASGGAWAAEITIGAVFSVTGPAAFLGEPERDTAEMIEEQVNKAGGVLGKKINLVVYDDETDSTNCRLAAQRLLKKDRAVAVIGPTISGNTLAIKPMFAQARAPLVSCAASEKIVKPLSEWVFKTAQSDRHAVRRIISHLEKQGHKRVAILTVSNGFGQSGRAVMQELLPAEGFELIADEIYGPKDTDMTPQLTKIKERRPDVIICWGTNPGPAVVARNSEQLGMKTPLYMSHGVASRKFIELAEGAAEGIYLPASHLIVAEQVEDDHPQKAVLTQYINDYKAKYGHAPSAFGGYAYDALNLVIEAIKRGNSAKPADIRDNLEKITGYVGASGVFNFSASEHNGLDQSAFVMVQIKDNDFHVVE